MIVRKHKGADEKMKELELKYGCNPNQKPSKIYMSDGSEPVSYTHLTLPTNREV